MSDQQDDTADEPAGTSADVEVVSTPKPGDAAQRTGLHGRSLVASVVGILAAGVIAWIWLFDAWPDNDPEPGAKLNFIATAYCKGTTTAAGTAVRRGVAAADRDVLPAGSVVSLITGDPEFDGVYTVLDTGPAVQGRVLDLYVWSCNEALAFGRRKVDATILRMGWDPRDSAPTLTDRLLRRRTARTHDKDEEAGAPRQEKTQSSPTPTAQPGPAEVSVEADPNTQGPSAAEPPREEPPAEPAVGPQ